MIMPRRYGGLCLPLAEAMTSGQPVQRLAEHRAAGGLADTRRVPLPQGGEEGPQVSDQQVGCLMCGVVAASVVDVPADDVGMIALGVAPDGLDVVRELGEPERDHGRAVRGRLARFVVRRSADLAVAVCQWIETCVSTTSGSRPVMDWLFQASRPIGESARVSASLSGCCVWRWRKRRCPAESLRVPPAPRGRSGTVQPARSARNSADTTSTHLPAARTAASREPRALRQGQPSPAHLG